MGKVRFIMQRKWQVLLVTSVAVFMSFLDVTIVNIAFPDIRASFPGTSLADLSWILNAYNIVFAALLVPAGRLADRTGRRRTFVAGMVTFLAASVAAGLAPTVEVLIAARVVQAAGAAALVPTSLALLLPEFTLQQRATATGIWGAMGAIAAAGGASLGGGVVGGVCAGCGPRGGVGRAVVVLRHPPHRPPRADPGAPAAPRVARAEPRPDARRGGGGPARRGRRAAVAGHREGPGLELGRARRRHARRRGRAAPRVRGAVESPSGAGRRARAVPRALVRRRQRRRVRLRARLLRVPARQRPVPHRPVALLGP